MLEQINKDLRAALLGGERTKAETLRGLKNALHYEAISAGTKDSELSDEAVQKVLAREAKKRAEAADIYKSNNQPERAEQELAELAIINNYLPKQLDETQIAKAVGEEMAKLEMPSVADMGKIIGAVRAKLGAGADGATIARLVKQALEK